MNTPKLKRLAQDRFLKGSALIFIAVVLANLFNYLYQITMGRLLTIDEFGEVNAIISFITIFSLPLGALTNYFAHETSTYLAQDHLTSVKNLHRTGLRKTLWVALVISLGILLLSPLIANYLEVSVGKIIFIIPIFLTTALAATNTGIIQGLQNFFKLSKLNIYASGLKLVLSVILVLIGWKIYGALGGLALSLLLSLVYSQLIINRELPRSKDILEIRFSQIYGYIGALFFANAFFVIMTQADLILVRHSFPPESTGLFASASVLGKAVLIVPATLVITLFPMVASNRAVGISSADMLVKALILTLALSGCGALVLFFFSEIIITLMFSKRYLGAAEVCAIYGLGMMPMAAVYVLMNFLLAQKKTSCVLFLGIAVIFELAGISLFGKDLMTVLLILFCTGCLALLPMVGHIFLIYKGKQN